MMLKVLLFLFVSTRFFVAYSQSRVLQLIDDIDKTPVGYVNVLNLETKVNTVSDESGFCFFFAKPEARLLISHVAYKDTILTVIDGDHHILLSLAPLQIQQIDVFSGERFDRKAASGVNNVPLRFLKSVPTFLGEPDIIKSLTFLPGVSEGREGYSHLFVRGGDQDQNLMLLDGATLFNINHFGGFVSMFNADMLGGVDFYKNAWPSRFGGRLSSVLDVRTAEGDFRHHGQSYQFGIIAPKFSVRGPLLKDRVAYNVGARRTLLDLFTARRAKSIRSGKEAGDIGNLAVQDINIRVDAKIKKDQHLSISALHGRDWYSFLEKNPESEQIVENRYAIKNELVALNYRWNATARTSFYGHASYSSYRHDYDDFVKSYMAVEVTGGVDPAEGKRLNSGNLMKSVKMSARAKSQFSNKIVLNYGLGNEILRDEIFLVRNVGANGSDSFMSSSSTGSKPAYVTSAFVEFDYRLINRLDLNGGMRVSNYAIERFNLVFAEPKLLLRYTIDERSTFNGSYAYQRQTVGLLAFTDKLGRFREYYTNINELIKPSASSQFSFGYFRGTKGFINNFSVELFHKSQKDNSKFIPSVNYEDDIVLYGNYLHRNGRLTASGAEFLLQKGVGVLQGSLSYTYSRSRSKFPTLNKGLPFDADFDFRHSANLLLLYAFGDGYRLSSHWSYKTGRPFTLPTGRFEMDDERFSFPIYTEFNNKRMPAFHRLDINLERRWSARSGNSNWFGVGIYNVYNRVNPFFAQPDYQTGKLEVVGMFPIIPFFYIGFEK